MPYYFLPEFWQQQWTVISSAPLAVVPLVVVVALVTWWVRGFRDGREIGGLRAENKVLEAQKRDALEKNEFVDREFVTIKATLSDYGGRLSTLEREDVGQLVADVTSATSKAETANTAQHKILAETGSYYIKLFGRPRTRS